MIVVSKNMEVGILKALKGFLLGWFKRLPPTAICFVTSAEANFPHAHGISWPLLEFTAQYLSLNH